MIDDQVRVSVQLDDGHIGSKVMIRYDDAALGKMFEVQETITQDVLHALRLKLQVAGRAKSGRQPAFASEAHRIYLISDEAELLSGGPYEALSEACQADVPAGA